MSELHELYRELIIDHGRHPRNFGKLVGADRMAEGFNPLCGDQLKVYLKINPTTHQIESMQFEGEGCAISMASASLMTEVLQGKMITDIQEVFDLFHQQLTVGLTQNKEATDKLGKLAVLSGVQAFPSRVKCATLAWHTLQTALHQSNRVTTTE